MAAARSDHECDLTIVEILRDGGLDKDIATLMLRENVSLEDRWALCEALEAWESRYGEEATTRPVVNA